ncbi:agmatine deiminase family protein [Winogradskyella aurantia]|uniref:Agmatine deiminase n=1 Tax=Winogradskyella aurantia TaxID=1915063 RepID=A0A265URT7_9FLAO|nr:agmatine deiminase family protein [Winogradskyella aurantia]OZV68010.1 hypothetical protein CA834_10185 [Winogradskyella aurantia]
MKMILQVLTFLLLLSGCSETKEESSPFVYPPEWKPQQAVWMSVNDRWADPENTVVQITARLKLIEALHKYVPVKLLTTSDSLSEAFLSDLVKMSVDTSRITTIIYPEPTYFLRDPGPIFLSNGTDLKMANWLGVDTTEVYTGSSTLRKTVDDSIAVRFGYEIENSPVRYDGGGIDVNNHSAMSIKDYALEHNEGRFTIEEIEKEILRLYGKKQMIWLEGVPLVDTEGLKVENYSKKIFPRQSYYMFNVKRN